MTSAADFDKKYDIVDANTPRHTLMCGRYKKSFAYFTMRHRLPVTITSIIDSLTKHKDELAEKFGEQCREEIKTVVGLLSKLKYELQTDKPLTFLTDKEPDSEIWHTFLELLPKQYNSFFKTCWLYAECYMYRRISSIFQQTESLHNYDYFNKQKVNAMLISVDSMEAVAVRTRRTTKDEHFFSRLLKLNLWGNRCDLSITSGKEVKPTGSDFELIHNLDSSLLINNTLEIWNCLVNPERKQPVIIDFICDNAGYELFTDFILAEYLVDKHLADKVRFNVKAIPWFISDVTPDDFNWSLKFWREHSSPVLRELGKKWTVYLEDGKFELSPLEFYWTCPYEYYRMRDFNMDLYKRLTEAHLIIFKGDLNYRKLLGDYKWDTTEDFLTCIRGFQPTNICALRTVKADLICGLRHGLADEMTEDEPDWMITGKYGLIQFAEYMNCGCRTMPLPDPTVSKKTPHDAKKGETEKK